MSDYTDDGFPRERYEGPMASAAKAENGNSLKNSKSSVDHEAAGKAETVTCENCRGKGSVLIHNGVNWNCLKCNGTGVRTTGKYLGTLPSTPDPVTDETLPSQVPTITVAHNGAATPPFPERYIKPAMGLGASGIENVTCGACGRPDRVLTAALADRDATIAEQAAEIERLKKNYEDAAGAFVIARESSATRHLAAQQMIAEQNELRLEVEKLKDLNYEAQDRYAALEAERDALKADVEKLRWIVNHHEPPHEAFARVVTERNEARADVERLNKEADSLAQQREHWQLRFGEACDERNEANARAEKYLAVILAKDAEIMALGQAWSASMATGQAMQDAGIQFRHVSQDIPPFVAEEIE